MTTFECDGKTLTLVDGNQKFHIRKDDGDMWRFEKDGKPTMVKKWTDSVSGRPEPAASLADLTVVKGNAKAIVEYLFRRAGEDDVEEAQRSKSSEK